MNQRDRRGQSRQAPPRPSLYPQWGKPPRVSNAHSLYRYGEQGILTRLIISADDNRRYFRYGLSVGEALIILGVIVFLHFLADLSGAGFESYLQAMGW